MRILLLHQYFLDDGEPGGSRFNQFAKYWEEQGHEVTVVAGNVNYSTGKKQEKYRGRYITKQKKTDKTTVYRTYVSEAYNASFAGRLWAYMSFTLSSLIACLFHVGKHDVLIVTSPPLFVGITGIIASWLKRIPMIFEVRDLWPESAIDTGVLKNGLLIKAAYLVEKLSYKYATKINVLTPAFREALIRKKGIAAEKLIFIPNGADLDIFQPGDKHNWVRERYQLHDKFVVSYFGAHGVANHLISLIRVAEICRDIPDLVFVLVGDGMEKERLQQYVQDKDLNNVLFIPPQPKAYMPDFCRASDVCTAVLQKIETFKTVYPNKVFDYMSCAKPILLGIDGVARQLVETSGAGYYVDPESPESFKTKIMMLYRDSQLSERLGRDGFEYVKQHFSREALAGEYERELRKVIGRNRTDVVYSRPL
ncbi:glycosyltransferase family 4 protein [Paenibacillus hemerocallicola]|uniref:Glycosyltransferase family 4 protein n=1 Tax=Paenibacillus hemerocallicola TaxID=1172614 RepID=A0A5C4TCT2_9BACL|nr:glycosyltransferase family 4 protein [Paenibacillus hemerocallicola]TNJ66705.1 glycosyltransferase family 4 protein [Paenibacillus hemerocallicola]